MLLIYSDIYLHFMSRLRQKVANYINNCLIEYQKEKYERYRNVSDFKKIICVIRAGNLKILCCPQDQPFPAKRLCWVWPVILERETEKDLLLRNFAYLWPGSDFN